MAETTYEVSGTQTFRDVRPGGTVKADADDPQIQRALARGHIRESKEAKAPPEKTKEKSDSGTAPSAAS